MTKRGFAEYVMPQVTIEPSRDSLQNAMLAIGTVTEEVDVVAEGVGKVQALKVEGKSARVRLGGDLQAPKLVNKVQPVYPPEAKAAGIQGIVILHAIIAMEGSPLSLRVMNSDINPELARAAVEAVSKWRYRSTLLNGEPIEVDTTIMVNFKLLP